MDCTEVAGDRAFVAQLGHGCGEMTERDLGEL